MVKVVNFHVPFMSWIYEELFVLPTMPGGVLVMAIPASYLLKAQLNGQTSHCLCPEALTTLLDQHSVNGLATVIELSITRTGVSHLVQRKTNKLK